MALAEMVAQAVTVTKKRRAGSAALSAPPANAPMGVVAITMESPEKPTTINFGQITDTCAESSMLQFGAPAHAQVARADRPSESAFWGLRGLFQRGRARGASGPLSVSRPFRVPHRLVRRLEVGGYASCASHRH